MFTSSDRAVCRDMEGAMGKDVGMKVDKEIEALLRLAADQNWEVKPRGDAQLAWYGPNGEGPVFTPTRVVGRGSRNVRTQLQRAGLDTSSLTSGKKPRVSTEVDAEHVCTDACTGTHIPLSPDLLLDQAIKAGAPAIAGAVGAMMTGKKNFDLLMAEYIGTVAGALVNFMEGGDMSPRGDQEELKEMEGLYLEVAERNEQLVEEVNKLKEKVAHAERSRDAYKVEAAEATERANRAENKLRTLKDIFGGEA